MRKRTSCASGGGRRKAQKLLTYAAYFAGLLSGYALATALAVAARRSRSKLTSMKCAQRATRDTRQFPSCCCCQFGGASSEQLEKFKHLTRQQGAGRMLKAYLGEHITYTTCVARPLHAA